MLLMVCVMVDAPLQLPTVLWMYVFEDRSRALIFPMVASLAKSWSTSIRFAVIRSIMPLMA